MKKDIERIEDIDPAGSLGLLAAGYKGVILWKKARLAAGLNNFADPEVELKSTKIIARKRSKMPNEKK
ncbi:MAG: hypothetical protein JXR53_08630 [Bacteroidales bacterium]|nr:hypothetical protein [Bacteroidales bacterium]